MDNYDIKTTKGKFQVTESTTDQVIITAKSIKKATVLCRNLNLGGGFAGWTPSFFITTAKKKRAA
jgi:hypothetical protein